MKRPEMKKIFITGASGFLGGHLYQLAKNNWQVYGSYYQNSPERVPDSWVQMDLKNPSHVKSFLKEIQPQVIIHTAAISNLDVCEEHPDLSENINVRATENLAEYAADLGIRLVYTSSDMVFNGTGRFYKEIDTALPLAVYGQHKKRSEEIVQSKCNSWVNARVALIYGRPLTGGSSFSQWMEHRLKNGEKVTLFQDQYRTPILVNNLAETLLELAESDYCGTLHLGGSNRIDRFSFGQQLCRICGYDEKLLKATSMYDIQPKAPRPTDVSLDISKAQSFLSTKLLSTAEGLQRMAGDQLK